MGTSASRSWTRGTLRADGEASGHSRGGIVLDRSFDSRLGRHVDGMTRTLLEARGAPGAEVQLDPIEPALPELDDRLLRARGVAVVALEAVAAGEAPCRLVSRFLLREAGHDLVEAGPLRDRQFGMLATLGVEEQREVQKLVRHGRMLWRFLVDAATQPRVDVPRRLLAVAHRRRHRPCA